MLTLTRTKPVAVNTNSRTASPVVGVNARTVGKAVGVHGGEGCSKAFTRFMLMSGPKITSSSTSWDSSRPFYFPLVVSSHVQSMDILRPLPAP